MATKNHAQQQTDSRQSQAEIAVFCHRLADIRNPVICLTSHADTSQLHV